MAGQAPPGAILKHAPDLARVEDRLRPRWMYQWQTDPAAIRELQQAKLVLDHRDGQFIALPQGVGNDQVVRHLVQLGISVYEIAPEAETLESFYLSLMNGQKGAGS